LAKSQQRMAAKNPGSLVREQAPFPLAKVDRSRVADAQ